jgi:hypothetical protein
MICVRRDEEIFAAAKRNAAAEDDPELRIGAVGKLPAGWRGAWNWRGLLKRLSVEPVKWATDSLRACRQMSD